MNKRIVPFIAVALALSAGAVFFFLRIYTVPGAASVQRGYIDSILKVVLSIGSVVFLLVITSLTYALVFGRRKQTAEVFPFSGNARLELAWTVIPLLVVIGVSTYGGFVLRDMTTAPVSSTLNVDVTAFRWGWKFSYPDYGINSLYLELEVNRPVELHLTSLDVVHSFWVQEFGPKQDAVPGMMMHLDLTPDKIGQYQVVCDQLCGAGHTGMTAPVYVVSHGDFATWVQQHQALQTTTPPTTSTATAGELSTLGSGVYGSNCAKCHGAQGQGGVGPRLIGAGEGLAKYTNAQALLNFVSTAMPLDAPGSLSREQSLELLSFLLVQNNILQPASVFDEGKLASVALK